MTTFSCTGPAQRHSSRAGSTTQDHSARTRAYLDEYLPSVTSSAKSTIAAIKALGPEALQVLEGHATVISSGLSYLNSEAPKGRWNSETRDLLRSNMKSVWSTDQQVRPLIEALRFLKDPSMGMAGYTCQDDRTTSIAKYDTYLAGERTATDERLKKLGQFWDKSVTGSVYHMSRDEVDSYRDSYSRKTKEYQQEFKRSLELKKQYNGLKSSISVLREVMSEEQLRNFPVPMRVSQVGKSH